MPSKSETADLKPCPFCGEVAGGVFEHGGPNDHWVVECSACRGEYSEEGREAAVAGWNRRVSLFHLGFANVQGRLEMIREALLKPLAPKPGEPVYVPYFT